jgi:hypothetical protein
MNIAEIESSLRDLVEVPFDPDNFIYRFLEIYGAPKATITKLRQASTGDLISDNLVVWKKKLFFRTAPQGKAAVTVDEMALAPRIKKDAPHFLISTDGVEFYALDLKADQTRDLALAELNDVFDFFLPLAGIERYEGVAENPADIKATARLAKLYDAILEANPDWLGHNRTHELNLFMTRMLFCFFAEDTSIFDHGLFTRTVMSLSRDDGSDTSSVLLSLFTAMNTPEGERGNQPDYACRFPFVNGGLFRDQTHIPAFSKRALRLLKECGVLSWRDINPDIFGSMIQAVVEPGLRGDMGMHYTSVPNIMKVLQPLFLLSLEEEFDAARDSAPKLQKLLQRIYSIRVFDPACGSGNFLIIAYRELRKLESRIFARQKAISGQWPLFSSVQLTQFCGIELTDFAAETAKLSLWIAEYQMNEVFKVEFGSAPPSLPLRDNGNVVRGNACRIDWLEICPKNDSSEIYVVGNPPYLGRAQQTPSQKEDMAITFANIKTKYKNLDYVACWTIKGADYCRDANAQCAFVTTNSICQGEQVALLWPHIFERGLEIGFAYQSFKWRNNATNNAGVTCVIVGIRTRQKTRKVLYSSEHGQVVGNICPYLIEFEDIIVKKRSSPLSAFPKMDFGSMANDGGNLLLSRDDRNELLQQHPEAASLIRPFFGSQEFIKGIERWCLWISDGNRAHAASMKLVSNRIAGVLAHREKSNREETRALASVPHCFGENRTQNIDAIIVPSVSSEQRPYLPVGLISAGGVINNLAFSIYNVSDYLLAILSSRLHLVWTSAVGGQLETRLRYSNTLVYNTFPVPSLSSEQKIVLGERAMDILDARESHPGKTIAWLYDPSTMPANLLQSHKNLDEALETIYIGRSFKNDTERLEHLFKLYSTMIKKELSTRAK